MKESRPGASSPASETTEGKPGFLVRSGLALADWSERWFPDPLVFAFLGVVCVFGLGVLAGERPGNLAIAGGQGFLVARPLHDADGDDHHRRLRRGVRAASCGGRSRPWPAFRNRRAARWRGSPSSPCLPRSSRGGSASSSPASTSGRSRDGEGARLPGSGRGGVPRRRRRLGDGALLLGGDDDGDEERASRRRSTGSAA